MATKRPFAAAWGEMMKSELVVNASLVANVSMYVGIGKRRDLPADTVLVHLPVRAVLAVKNVVCVVDVQLERSGHIPLVVIWP